MANKTNRKKRKGLSNYNKTLITVLALTLFFRLFIFRAVVDGESMMTTYHNGESVWVLRGPFVDYERGDVIIFDNPYGEEMRAWYNIGDLTDFKMVTKYMKRVVGVPGDTVHIYGDLVEVNGELVNEEDQGNLNKINTLTEDETYVLGDTEYLVLGDNRLESLDSRYFGSVNKDKIMGKLYKERVMSQNNNTSTDIE